MVSYRVQAAFSGKLAKLEPQGCGQAGQGQAGRKRGKLLLAPSDFCRNLVLNKISYSKKFSDVLRRSQNRSPSLRYPSTSLQTEPSGYIGQRGSRTSMQNCPSDHLPSTHKILLTCSNCQKLLESELQLHSGTIKEPKPKLLSPDIFRLGRGLPREGVGAKKFGMSLETGEIKLFGRDIPGFCWDIPAVPEKFKKKKFVFNF